MTKLPGPEAAIKILRSTQYPQTLKKLKSLLCKSGFEPSLVEDALFSLLNLEVLEVTGTSVDFESSPVELGPSSTLLETACIEIFAPKRTNVNSINREALIQPQHSDRNILVEGLCTTLPLQRTQTLSGLRPLLIRHAIVSLVESARSTLYIASPYLDVHGMSSLEDAFEKAARAGVRLQLLTRIENRGQPDLRLIQGMLHLLKVFGSRFSAANLAYLSRNPVSGYANITSALHAKLVVCDRESAYIGSADLRHTGLHKNFEIGIVLRDTAQVETVADLFETAWVDSESISPQYIEEKAGL